MSTTKPSSAMLDLDTQINAQTGTTYTLVGTDNGWLANQEALIAEQHLML